MLTACKRRSVQCRLSPRVGGNQWSLVEVFQRDLSAVTLSHFVSHTELINFLNYYHGISFVARKNNRCYPLIDNLYSLLQALGPKRHSVQETK